MSKFEDQLNYQSVINQDQSNICFEIIKEQQRENRRKSISIWIMMVILSLTYITLAYVVLNYDITTTKTSINEDRKSVV